MTPDQKYKAKFKKILANLPKIYSTEELGVNDKPVQVIIGNLRNGWRWMPVEKDPDYDNHFFGLVHGFEAEYGYFSLDEVMSLPGTYIELILKKPAKVNELFQAWDKPDTLSYFKPENVLSPEDLA